MQMLTGENGVAYPGHLTANGIRGHFQVSLSSSVGLTNHEPAYH
jgi:hypothetical protein